MVKDGDAARKEAADCIMLAAEASSDERRDMLRAMARSWMTLANQMNRFERLMSGSERLGSSTSHEDRRENP